MTTDASNYGISAILSQGKIGRDRPIAYASRMLRGAEKTYPTYEKEALAVIFGVKHFRQYLYNSKFTILTDHQALIYFKTADCNARVMRWRFYLSDYQYEIIYRSGKRQVNADALSRNIPEEPEANIFVTTRNRAKLLEPEKHPDALTSSNDPSKLKPTRPAPAPPRTSTRVRKLTEKAQALEDKKQEIAKVKKKSNNTDKLRTPRPTGNGNSTSTDSESDTSDTQRQPRKIIRRRKSPTNKKTQWDELPQEPFSTDSEEDATSEKELSESSRETTNKLTNLKFSKESLEYCRDNLIYFISPDGKPLDLGAEKLFKCNLVEQRSVYAPQTVQRDKIRDKQYFGLCLAENESVISKRQKLLDVLSALKEKLLDLNVESFSLAKSNNITNIP